MIMKEVPANAGKLLGAIASIGYDVEVALCDLIDNSFDAGAKNIKLIINELIEDNESTDSVGRYVIADDGTGMNESALINAFTLGSDRNYGSHSLGKFGLGLKSAGLSLGDKLTIITKSAESENIIMAQLSIRDVEEQGKYIISIGNVSGDYAALWESFNIKKSGTILVIDDLNDSQPSFSEFLDYINRYCGQVYHMIIEEGEVDLSINGITVTPIDPLFIKEAIKSGSLGNPDDWNGISVKLLLEDTELSLDDGILCKISATNLIHPPSFEINGGMKLRDQKRDVYQIENDPYTKKPRHGFYVYRNKRIIVMAERFHGMVSNLTPAWAFRARLMFDETADKVLALDVKKKHLKLPKSARSNLKNLISNYHTKSINAWKIAGAKYSEWKNEKKENIANTSVANSPASKLDYAPASDIKSQDDLKQREILQESLSKKTLENIQDKKITPDEIVRLAKENNAIILVDGLKGNAIWLPYAAVELGKAETLINKQHTWVDQALNIASDKPETAIIIYQLFAILSRAEMEVRSTPMSNISPKVIDKIFDSFRRKTSIIGEDVVDNLIEEVERIKNIGVKE